MGDWLFGLMLFVVVFGAAGLGSALRARLSEHQLSRESIELVQLTITLLVTFTSIVLALLTGSVKAGFDQAYMARGAYAAQFVQTDRCLRDYGPATDAMREKLRGYVGAVIASTWPEEPAPPAASFPDVKGLPRTGEAPALGAILDRVRTDMRSLQPPDAAHERILSDCLSQFASLTASRWRVIEAAPRSISPPFYGVLALWLVILFASLGLTAPPNALTIVIVALSALSITIAVAVISDMDEPYGGVFGIPSDSMRNALADMMRGADVNPTAPK